VTPGLSVVEHADAPDRAAVVRQYVAIVLMGIAGIALASVKGIIIGTYVQDFGQSPSQAGYLLSTAMLAAMLGALASTIAPQKGLLVGALLLIFAGHLCTAWFVAGNALFVWQSLAGFGHGFAIGRFARAVATVEVPQRITGVYGVSYLVLSSLCSVALPNLKLALGPHALFLMLALSGPLALVGVKWFPAVGKGSGHASAATAVPLRVNLVVIVAVTLLLWYVSIGGYYPYVGQIGEQAGLGFDERARILGIGQLFGLVGISLAIFVGNRFGSLRPLLLFISLQVLACALLLLRRADLATFALSVWLYVFAWLAGFPFLLGMLSTLDRAGRLNPLINIMGNAAYGIGPAGAGFLVRSAGAVAEGLHWIQLIGLGLLVLSGAVVIALAVVAESRARARV
jgi:hypothetical protein